MFSFVFTSFHTFYNPFAVRMLRNWNYTVNSKALPFTIFFYLFLLVCCTIYIHFNWSIIAGKYYYNHLAIYILIFKNYSLPVGPYAASSYDSLRFFHRFAIRTLFSNDTYHRQFSIFVFNIQIIN